MLLKLSVAIVGIVSLSSAYAQTQAKDPVGRMQQIVQSYVDNKSFMGTVLVAKDGKTLIDQGYGFADLEWNIPNTSVVKFRLGSITKQFTAASASREEVLKLAPSISSPQPPATRWSFTLFDFASTVPPRAATTPLSRARSILIWPSA